MPQEKLGFWESIVEFISDFVIFPIVNINIVNILDILLLSFLIYIIYKFIRDRHAGRTLIGFGLIMLLYIVSDIFGMVAINSILKNFYAVGIIALCVLFQPELREVLAEFGTTTSLNFRRIRNRHTVDDDNILQAIEEISAAAFDLSSRREGALIVLERSGRLHNQMTEGTPVDAVVSRQLLCNIFVNRSPLHDGAVIIRDCRIVSASNKSKTISEDADIAEGLGTRHRAALKISEISDAVVLIVSEETGTISVANNKILNRFYDDIGKGGKHKSTDLRDDLFKLMTGKSVNDMLVDRIAKSVADKTKKNTEKEGKENGTNETV